jgi:hypothetical protein
MMSVKKWNGLFLLILVMALVVSPLSSQTKAQAPKKGAAPPAAAAPAPEPPPPPDAVDYEAVYRIKDEGLQRSQVMEITSYLTDVHGPRLTGSPSIRKAGEWAVNKLKEWGLANVKLEPWTNPFGRGWSNERFYMQVLEPVPFPVIGYPPAWTPGTKGLITCEVVRLNIEREEDFAKYKGQIRDKCVLTEPMREVPAWFRPPGERYTDAQLQELTQQPIRAGAPPAAPGAPGQVPAQFQAQAARAQLRQRISRFLQEEGVAIWIQPGRGDGGTVFVGGGGSRNPSDPPAPVQAVIAIEHYGRIFRILSKTPPIPVKIEANIENKFYDDDNTMFNVIAEIPGTDKADEIVMLGAHFDAWHSGTGATDNAAGSAVMMEAIRILKATGLKLRRTVRLGLWTGEEQGLIGSREYVTAHFGEFNRTTNEVTTKPDHAKFAGYFNVDNGTGKIRGIYLQGNEAVAPIFKIWMEPFHNMGMTTLTIRNTGGTDHLSFDRVGLPGFQFIQDEIEYETRTHHSNMDVYERIQEADMKQMAVIVASFVYHTANRERLLPRKPLPTPRPAAAGATPAPPRPQD